MSLKCYSYWQLGAMQIDLTPLTLRITEDSAKQLVNYLQLTMICMIKMLRDGEYILCFACTFRDINKQMEYLLGRKEQRTLELIINDQ